jgi:hypothetical protein
MWPRMWDEETSLCPKRRKPLSGRQISEYEGVASTALNATVTAPLRRRVASPYLLMRQPQLIWTMRYLSWILSAMPRGFKVLFLLILNFKLYQEFSTLVCSNHVSPHPPVITNVPLTLNCNDIE